MAATTKVRICCFGSLPLFLKIRSDILTLFPILPRNSCCIMETWRPFFRLVTFAPLWESYKSCLLQPIHLNFWLHVKKTAGRFRIGGRSCLFRRVLLAQPVCRLLRFSSIICKFRFVTALAISFFVFCRWASGNVWRYAIHSWCVIFNSCSIDFLGKCVMLNSMPH